MLTGRGPIVFVLAVCLLALAFAACGDDETGPPDPTASGPTASPAPSQAADTEAIAATLEYLQTEGVDGNKGELSDPLNCSAITDETPGEFCVHDDFSIYAPGLVILVVGETENPDEQTWEIRLERDDSGWQVTSAEPFGSSE